MAWRSSGKGKNMLDTNSSYVVASLGRCGSQLMTVALHNHLWGFGEHEKIFLKKTRPFIREYPKNFKNNVVYKTHLYPIEYPKNCKIIFTFGDPLDIVLSVVRKSKMESHWGPAHFKNLDANWSEFGDILCRDVLRLEYMFDSFYKPQTCDIMCLRYETLWSNEDKISNFLGFKFKLPEQKNREASILRQSLTSTQLKNFNTGYFSLIEKINNAKDYKIWSTK